MVWPGFSVAAFKKDKRLVRVGDGLAGDLVRANGCRFPYGGPCVMAPPDIHFLDAPARDDAAKWPPERHSRERSR
jgi:hypothetical protein